MTVREGPKTMEEVAGRESKADPSVTAARTLEQRVTRLEGILTKHLHGYDGQRAICNMGTLHTGSSQMSKSEVYGAVIKEQHLAKAKTPFRTPQICLAAFHINENEHKVAACPTDDGVE